jgi:hypothetical protein
MSRLAATAIVALLPLAVACGGVRGRPETTAFREADERRDVRKLLDPWDARGIGHRLGDPCEVVPRRTKSPLRIARDRSGIDVVRQTGGGRREITAVSWVP